MVQYRRSLQPGGCFFFTVVTYNRRPLLTSELARICLRASIDKCRSMLPFTIEAFVLLPDHLHAIWTLPPGDSDYSKRWGLIKAEFTKTYLAQIGLEESLEIELVGDNRRAIWQPRFWEHTIHYEEELENHLNYIHYNPVKHGLVNSPHEWEWSSFHRYLRNEYYEVDWGTNKRKSSDLNFRI
ncbi:MAG: transposase [Planctomycetaceae bacterium]